LLIGGVVCTALSMTGSLVTEFKISYWLGATPRRIQWSNIFGAAVSSVTVTAMILLFAKVYGYVGSAQHPTPMPAPQANAMAAVIQSVMSTAEAPWLLYGVGAAIALIVEMMGISALAFALGTFPSSSIHRFSSAHWWQSTCGDPHLTTPRAKPATIVAP
jgi:uncharacterized oligopeptide transporter (OPT) family protein